MASSPGGVATAPSDGSGDWGLAGLDALGSGLGASDGAGFGSVVPPDADEFDDPDDPDVVEDTSTAMSVATIAMLTRVIPVHRARRESRGRACAAAAGHPCWEAGGKVDCGGVPGGP
jgi:hypothetical protein